MLFAGVGSKLVPVIVTAVPTGPDVGVNEEIVGAWAERPAVVNPKKAMSQRSPNPIRPREWGRRNVGDLLIVDFSPVFNPPPHRFGRGSAAPRDAGKGSVPSFDNFWFRLVRVFAGYG